MVGRIGRGLVDGGGAGLPPADLLASVEQPPRRGPGRYPRRLIISGGFVVVFLLAALILPEIMDYDLVTTNTGERLLPPLTVLESGERAWLGTDQVGRDMVALVVEGARISAFVGVATVLAAGLIGTILGLLSGYYGRWLDTTVMRIADIQLAFPPILLAIFIASILGPSIANVIITLAITRWVVFARVARASTLPLRNREYVDAARVLGATNSRIITTEILPAILTPLMVVATVEFGLVIIAEASLSFLGLGSPQNLPSWGLTIANGRDYLNQAWWIATMPGIALATLMIGIGTFSDELRDHMNPRIRGRR